MKTKTQIVTRLLEEKHITAEEAVTLLTQEQPLPQWPCLPGMPIRKIPEYGDNPYWPQRIWCGGSATTNGSIQPAPKSAPDSSDGL